MELVVASVAELRDRITQSFEEVSAAVLEGATSSESGRFACAITGGSTALIFLGALRDANVRWPDITLYWGDERAVPPEHPDSNYGLAERLLLAPLGPRAPFAVRMRGEVDDLEAAAREYENELPHALDLIVLGVGEDGHVCALFPQHSGLSIKKARVFAIADAPKPPPRRLTLSLPYLCAARRVWVVAIGPRKLRLLEEAVSGTAHVTPLDHVMHGAKDVTIFTDQSIRRGFAR